MKLHIEIAGVLLVILSLAHLYFPKYFHWRKDLAHISLINRQMMHIHTLFIGLTVFLMGIFCISSASEILGSNTGKKVALGFAFFWAVRLAVQFFGYSSKLWVGKKFETVVHTLFSILWSYLSAVFFLAYFL